MSDYQEKRIAEAQARKSLKKANPRRQHGSSNGNSVARFQYKASALVDRFALFIEEQMLQEPNTGQGCRVQTYHVEMAYSKFENLIDKFMEEERNRMSAVKAELKRASGEEE